jgi:hypothetical protein
LIRLFNFLKKTKNTNPIDEVINSIIIAHESYFNKIDSLLPSHKDIAYKLFQNIVRKFIQKIYDAPASEKHHHSEPFGLLKHSLETVINALVAQHRILELKYDSKGNLDSQFNLHNKGRILYRTAISALFHDAGKIFDFIITADGVTFDALEENLLDFKLNHPNYEIEWKRNRTKKHEKRNIVLLFELLQKEDRQYLSSINFLQLIDDFFGYAPKDTIQEIIKEADIKSSITNVSTINSKDKEINPESKTETQEDEEYLLANYFLESIQDLVNQNNITINRIGGRIFVQDTVSFIVNPITLEEALQYMQKKYRYKTTKEHLINILKNKNVILSDEAGKTYFYATLVFSDKREVKLNFIIVKNKFLWGCSKPDNFSGEIILQNFVKIEDIQGQNENKEKQYCSENLKTKIDSQTDSKSESKTDDKTDNNTEVPQNEETEQSNVNEKEKKEKNKDSKRKKMPLYEKFITNFKEFISKNQYELENKQNKPIFITTVGSQEYIVFKYIEAFEFLNSKTKFFGEKNIKKEIDRLCNSLNNSNYVLKVDNKCILTIEIQNKKIKGVLFYKETLFP